MPDPDEGWYILNERAHRQGAAVRAMAPPAHGDLARMRAAEKEAEDPFDLDDLIDGRWLDEAPSRQPPPGFSGFFTFIFDAVPAAADLVDAVNQFVAVVNDTGTNLQRLTEALTEMTKEGPLVNRRRHGFAAWCPRHGETKGGLCRKCSR